MSAIEKLRDFEGDHDYDYVEEFESIEAILEGCEDGVTSELVEEYEDNRGRWTYDQNRIYKVTEGDDVAYFKLIQERGATEMQDGGDYGFALYEVYPKTVTKTIYV